MYLCIIIYQSGSQIKNCDAYQPMTRLDTVGRQISGGSYGSDGYGIDDSLHKICLLGDGCRTAKAEPLFIMDFLMSG